MSLIPRCSTLCRPSCLFSCLIKHYSSHPKTVSSKLQKKKLFREICNHKELVALLNARLSQLQGSSDEFHVLRPAHHEGSFEDRLQELRYFYDSAPIGFERSVSECPLSGITPDFIKELVTTQQKLTEISSDVWHHDYKSFHNQMMAVIKKSKGKKKQPVSLKTTKRNLNLKASRKGKNVSDKLHRQKDLYQTVVPTLVSPLGEWSATEEDLASGKFSTSEEVSVPGGDFVNDLKIMHDGQFVSDEEVLLSERSQAHLYSDIDTEEVNSFTDTSNQMVPGSVDPKSCSTPDANLDSQKAVTTAAATVSTANTKAKTKSRSKKPLINLKKSRNLERWRQNPVEMNLMFNNDLEAYVNACLFSGMVNKALAIIKFYNYQHKHRPAEVTLKIIKPEIYSNIMHALAKQGNFDSIQELFKMMKIHLKPTLQCYAACLECLGRKDSPDFQLGEHILQDLKRDGYSASQIFDSCTFRRDERQYVLKALKLISLDYEPSSKEINMKYSRNILQDLNTPPLLDTMIEKNPYHGVVDNDHLKKQLLLQHKRECDDHVVLKSVITQEKSQSSTKPVLEKLLSKWKGDLEAGFKRKINIYENKKYENSMTLYPYLKLFPVKDYVNIMLREAQRLASDSEAFSPSLNFLWLRMGNKVYYRFLIEDKINSLVSKKTVHLYNEYIEKYNEEQPEMVNHRLIWLNLMKEHCDGPSLDVPLKTWPLHVVKGVGRILFDIILYDLHIELNRDKDKSNSQKHIPAFYTVYRNYSFITKEEVKPHPKTMKIFQTNSTSELVFDTVALPMLVPPVPWISENLGTNLLATTKLVRLADSMHSQNKLSQVTHSSSEELSAVFDGLNILSACPWTINKPILDLIIKIFNNKGNKNLDIPPPSSECPPYPKITSDMTVQQRSQAQRLRIKLKQQSAEMYSLWCNELYKLSIANHFRDEVFWFPHSIDFRGRTYPCPPHLNHLGSDVSRSILCFAKGQKLGPHGLDWLKIHLVNLTGFQKRASNKERLQFANDHLEDILDSGDNPVEGSKWWQASDNPWQTLACCKEIAKAIRSPNPSEFISHLPVHQDGSCNGLQHYAALGRDQAGAESVNLCPFNHPKDVYSDICELVEKERQKDAENDIAVAQKLEGFVKRKVIKQTIMTTVYGVTKYGAKHQILKQLKDLPSFDQDYLWAACIYLTDKTFYCLNEMFTAARDIQIWLTLCAHQISTVCQQPVNWTTPLGLPVVQPYHKITSMQRWGVSHSNLSSTFEKPNSVKQKNAFPPNFVHSLDSTHMLLTALHCIRSGITYVSVHDCFWTHASSVEIMNQICREQFVALHNEPILEDLSKHLIDTYCSNVRKQQIRQEDFNHLLSIFSNVPHKGEFQLEKILQSTYFFS
ncbi:DNA-directed RNA polymerase, mitochondrial [Octopus vulgaris]|uniref:DNA-directed RNA polymerase n=1 Tax=Octopus vulgaris TaxID=6645 RepID=A0AA36BUJ1_OCTVU|nr:DNA-directed RNA polymerase, mitochondrial [Octopus vulgaris]